MKKNNPAAAMSAWDSKFKRQPKITQYGTSDKYSSLTDFGGF